MPIRFKVAKLEDVPEAQRTLYKSAPENGFYHLDVDGAADVDTVTEFRNNNRALMRELGVTTMAEAQTRLAELKELDPAEYKKLKREFETLRGPDGKIDVEKLLTDRTAEMRGTHEKALKKEQDKNTALSSRLQTILIDEELSKAAAKKGILPSAIEDVQLRGRSIFKMEGDKIVPYGPDGKVMYGSKGEEMSIGEWVEKLAANAPHLFEPNKGGGAQGDRGSGGHKYTQPNPYSKKTLNRTEQARLEKTNPALAQSLQQQAEL